MFEIRQTEIRQDDALGRAPQLRARLRAVATFVPCDCAWSSSPLQLAVYGVRYPL